MTAPTRVLIVDDSVIVRGLLTRAVELDPSIRVTGTAMHGEAALAWLEKNTADVIILDVEMPVMDGLTTLEILRRRYPGQRVIMASSMTQSGAETTLRALSLGAASCIAKPVTSSMAESIRQLSVELVPQIRALTSAEMPNTTNGRYSAGGASPARLDSAGQNESPAEFPEHQQRVRPRILVIGASTGGPTALTDVLTELPGDFDLPTLIVQHMPAQFTPILASRLNSATGRRCVEAVDGMSVVAGEIRLAPGGYHMHVEQREQRLVLSVTSGPPEHFCRPSVNPLFRSVSRTYGNSVLAVMLTGMGADGLEGTREVFAAGGTVIAQDRASSVIWGMPGAVVREGLAHFVLPLSEIAPQIKRLCALEACSHDT